VHFIHGFSLLSARSQKPKAKSQKPKAKSLVANNYSDFLHQQRQQPAASSQKPRG